ncbi:MAG: hypothetical protein AAF244_01875 [Pseudomonadota bacterium]
MADIYEDRIEAVKAAQKAMNGKSDREEADAHRQALLRDRPGVHISLLPPTPRSA